MMLYRLRRIPGLALLAVIPVLASLACTISLIDFSPTPTTPPPTPVVDLPTPVPMAEVTFRVVVPENTPPGEPVQLSVLDEVTGLALNPQRYKMEKVDSQTYEVTVPFPNKSAVKYRYTRQGALTAVEHLTDGRPVRYRIFMVDGPGMVNDVVARWNDGRYTGPTGRISGRILDPDGQPVPDILVAAGGDQTLTNWDGTYLIEGLPPGTHNLVAYARDGAYRAYQQGAMVASEATTPASINLSPVPLVDVVFIVTVPEDTIPAVPVRLAGNLIQLGNIFADLSGGISTPAARLPTLTYVEEGKYTLTMALPVGADVQYKYTLGDGFWNAEHDRDGNFTVRRLIVPDTGITVHDTIATWESGRSAPIWFEVTIPESTPPEDTISIQFNPYGWTQPVPMWRVSATQWVYLLSSPLDILGKVGYRYCRNLQCGSADDVATAGQTAIGRPANTSLLFQTLKDEVKQWMWMEPYPGTVTVPAANITPREAKFVAGVELQAAYHPSWLPQIPATMQKVKSIHANWVILASTWSFTNKAPPVFQIQTGEDMPWSDLTYSIEQAQAAGLNVALNPAPRFPVVPDEWWNSAPRDFAWWSVWFERYRTFAMHHAGLAARENVKTLVLGGDWLNPALPDGFLADGFSSGVPADAEQRWRDIIADVRAEFDGQIAWAMAYPRGIQNPPPFLDAVDQIYLLWSAPLTGQSPASEEALEAEASRLLDQQVLPFLMQFDKPLVIVLAYPSARGGATGCLPSARQDCLPLDALSRPNPDIPGILLDLQEQVDAYNAMLAAVNDRDWVAGVVSSGFYPPVGLRDKSISIHGKPAENVLEYWFARWAGEEP